MDLAKNFTGVVINVNVEVRRVSAAGLIVEVVEKYQNHE